MTDTSLYEQQSLIEDSARRFLDHHYSFEARRKIIHEEVGYSTQQWKEMAELGWMLLPMSADYGGLGGDMALVSTLTKEFGRSLFVNPFLGSAVVSTKIIEESDRESLRSEILDGIGAGGVIVSPALYESQVRYDLDNIATTASEKDDSIVLNGTKTAALYGNVASELLVLARREAEHKNADFSLYLVPVDQQGVEMIHHRTHDGGRMSDVLLNDVKVNRNQILLRGQKTLPIVKRAIRYANASICAELVGAMEATFEMTLEYLKSRQQFGKQLSSFQALQHRMVDMFMRCQLAESMRREAARAIESANETEQDMIISAAKCEIARSALLNAEEAVQLHGAMGMMDEMPVGHYLKRVFTLGLLFGDADYHQNCYRNMRVQASE